MTRQLDLLDSMVMDGDSKLYHTHWLQGKTAKGILLQWVVPKLWREQLLALHHSTPIGGHLVCSERELDLKGFSKLRP